MKPMTRVIGGKVYNTETATLVCDLDCSHYPNDFQYHDTRLYRTKKGAYFIAGTGGPMSMWRCKVQNGYGDGGGIRAVDYEEALMYAEAAELDPEEMIEAGFKIEEG